MRANLRILGMKRTVCVEGEQEDDLYGEGGKAHAIDAVNCE